MPKYKPLPPLERLHELLEVVAIPEDKFGKWSGLVWRINRARTAKATSVAGCLIPNPNNPDRADWRVKIDGVRYVASRVIYYMTYGEDPKDVQVDHKDQNWLNNNGQNLRLDTDGGIQRINSPTPRNNTSGVMGVSWMKKEKKWTTKVRSDGRSHYLGLYTCKVEAARVVRDKWIELGWHKKGRKLPDLNKVQCDCGACKR